MRELREAPTARGHVRLTSWGLAAVGVEFIVSVLGAAAREARYRVTLLGFVRVTLLGFARGGVG